MNGKKKKVFLGEIHQTKKSQVVGIIKAIQRLNKLTPLKEFINMGDTAIKDMILHIQAFSLFHFLQEANGEKYKDGFHKYLAEIAAGRGGDAKVFERYVGKISEIESAYLKYISKLKSKSNLKLR